MIEFEQAFDPEQAIADAIDGAEEIRLPLDGLVERTAADPDRAVPFAPEILQELSALKNNDRAAFEALRAQLKQVGCRVTALDDALPKEDGGSGGGKPSQADILVALAGSAELFHVADGTGYADLSINGHRETWPVRNKGSSVG